MTITTNSWYSYLYVAGSITGPDGSTLVSWGVYDYYTSMHGEHGPYTDAGTYTISHGADPGYNTVDSWATVTPGSAPDWTDAEEATCGTDPLDSSDEPTDTDGDGLCDDAQDDDNDGDGFSNDDESTNCGEGNDPLDSSDSPTDTDADGSCDALDSDDDDDGVDDASDAAPRADGASAAPAGDATCVGEATAAAGDESLFILQH